MESTDPNGADRALFRGMLTPDLAEFLVGSHHNGRLFPATIRLASAKACPRVAAEASQNSLANIACLSLSLSVSLSLSLSLFPTNWVCLRNIPGSTLPF